MEARFGQFCPVAAACEIFAERWTPIILRELLAGSRHFNEIHRGMPRISRALLSRRLRQLELAGVIAKKVDVTGQRGEYELTAAGQEFEAVIEALGNWGQRWTIRVQPANLDAGLLMWNVRRRIALDLLPESRVVALFRFFGVPIAHRGPRKFWLTLDRSCVDVCVTDPGFDVDIHVDADLAMMTSVWLGDVPFAEALRSKKVTLSGRAALTRRFPSWLLLSHFASAPRPSQE